MEKFLMRCKDFTNNLHNLRSFKIVLGNESCDLDSAICALTYAYFLNHKRNIPVFPIFNILQEEIMLKTEVVYYLKQNNISLCNLIYRDSLNLASMENMDFEMILVDHHILSESWSHLSAKVTEILDHRPKDPKWNWNSNVQSKVQTVGSCATLVTKEIFQDDQDLRNKDLFVLAKPLRATIILDTINFSKSAARATELDLQMVVLLEKIMDIPPNMVSKSRLNVFEELVKARTDISNLNAKQILLKDAKIAGKLPISGMPILVQTYLLLPGSLDALLEISIYHKTDIVILMGMHIEGEFVTRDIGIFSKNGAEKVKEIVSALENCGEPELLLEQKTSPIERVLLFNQGNTRATRKHIYPILKRVNDKFS